MDGLQYCRERVLVPGARLNLIRHFIDPELVERLVVLHAFYSEIASIPERVSDSAVARSKLGWWQEEIVRCWQGEGRHPISLAAQQQGITGLLSASELTRLVIAVAAWTDAPPLANLAELTGHCAAIGGLAAQLEAKISNADASSLEPALHFGTARYLVALIRDIGLDARAGRWYIPMDLQARYQFGLDQAVPGARSRTFVDLIGELSGFSSELVEKAQQSLSQAQQGQLRHHLIQAALDRKLVQKMQANPHKILENRIMLSPFASLWTVWQTARKTGVE